MPDHTDRTYYTSRQDKLLRDLRDHRDCFETSVREQIPEIDITTLWSEVEARFEALIPRLPFIGGRKNPLTENLVISAGFLVLFQALDARDVTEDDIDEIAWRAAEKLVARRSVLAQRIQARFAMSWLSKFLLRRMAARSQQRIYPEDFVVDFVDGDGESFEFGYDIQECGICKLFAAEGAEWFARHMCRVDYLTSSMSGLELIRTGTIAEGAEKCDFRFKRKENTR